MRRNSNWRHGHSRVRETRTASFQHAESPRLLVLTRVLEFFNSDSGLMSPEYRQKTPRLYCPLPSSSVSLSNFYLAVPMRGCLGKHSCMSSPFPIAILNGTCSLWALRLFCGDEPAIKTNLKTKNKNISLYYQHVVRSKNLVVLYKYICIVPFMPQAKLQSLAKRRVWVEFPLWPRL